MKENEIIIKNLLTKEILEVLKKYGITKDNDITKDFKKLINKIHFPE